MEEKLHKLAYLLQKDVNKAIYQYNMIQHRDRVAIAVSGGKDSLTLLKLLDFRRSRSKEKYEIVAIHISGDSSGPIHPIHPPLLEWLEKGDYTFIVEELEIKASENIPMNCQRCTWNRRKQIFDVANKMDCNVVAYGHHADDFAQTTLMNLLFHRRLETISPVSTYFGGIFRLIRPLCYLSEKEIYQFAKASNFPKPPGECPQSNLSHRNAIKTFLDEIQKQHPDIRANLVKAGLEEFDKTYKL